MFEAPSKHRFLPGNGGHGTLARDLETFRLTAETLPAGFAGNGFGAMDRIRFGQAHGDHVVVQASGGTGPDARG